jgi:hypothetical protein
MNSSEPLDITLGNKISRSWTAFLVDNFNTEKIFFDADKFKQKMGYAPCYSSCFMVARCGSFDMTTGPYKLYIHNGTLASVDTLLDNMSFNVFATIYEQKYKI